MNIYNNENENKYKEKNETKNIEYVLISFVAYFFVP